VDLHADSRLWGRDLSVRSDRGNVDLPRLIAGNVGPRAGSPLHRRPFIGRPVIVARPPVPQRVTRRARSLSGRALLPS